MPSNIKQITALKHSDGAIIVIFLVGSGFPLYHDGYIFNGCGKNVACIDEFKALKQKWSLRQINANWYHFFG